MLQRRAAKRPQESFLRRHDRALQLIVLALAIVVLVPQRTTLLASLKSLPHLHVGWVAIGLVLVLITNVFAALVYLLISPKELPFKRTLITQFAAGFANKLLPSGIGSIGLFTLFITKQTRIGSLRAAVVATANNIIGFIAFILTLLVIIVPSNGAWQWLRSYVRYSQIELWLLIGAIILVTALLIYRLAEKRLHAALGSIAATLQLMFSRPGRLAAAVASSIAITLCYIGTLQASMLAAGIHAPLYVTATIFTAGMLAIILSPTPNGLGPTEVIMGYALTRTGVSAVDAASAVLLFRLLTFWLPIPIGYAAFRVMRNRSYY